VGPERIEGFARVATTHYVHVAGGLDSVNVSLAVVFGTYGGEARKHEEGRRQKRMRANIFEY